MARTFKTASLAGYGALGSNADVLRAFAKKNPEVFKGFKPADLDRYIQEHQAAVNFNAESGGDFKFSDSTLKLDDLLGQYQMNSIGAEGLENGRRKAIVDADGNTVFQGGAYSYNAAKDNLDGLMKGLAMMGAVYGASSLLGGAGAGASSAGGVGADAAGHGAFLGESAWTPTVGGESLAGEALLGDATKAALYGEAGYGAGMTGAQTGIFDGILGATGSTGLASAGGQIAGGIGGLLNLVKENPQLAGAIAGGLLGGGSAGSGGSGYTYKGPMPTITRGNWSPTATAQYMQPTQLQVRPPTQGNLYSGLLGYLGG